MDSKAKKKATSDKYIQEYVLENLDYDVRSDGEIWTRKALNGPGLLPNGAWRQVLNITGGYFKVSVRVDGKQKLISVARIVYMKFNGALHEDLVINHIDENKLNNRPSNLELVTVQKNSTHNKTIEDFRNKSIENHKLDMNKARECRRLRALGKTYKQLALMFQVSEGTIYCVVNNKIWREAA